MKKVIILAAGIGSRLHPITHETPKALVKVQGKSILQHQIDAYLAAGIQESDIFVATGYMHQQVCNFLKVHYPHVSMVENKEYLETNNMYSLHLAINKVVNVSTTSLLVSNGDCVYEPSIIKMLVESDDNSSFITCQEEIYLEESMKITVDENNHCTDIAKTITADNAFGVSIDLYRFNKEAINHLRKSIENFIIKNNDLNSWSEIAFPYVFKNSQVKPLNIGQKKWVEIDSFEDLRLADELFHTYDYKNQETFIIDLDGTVYIGNSPIKGAVNFVTQLIEENKKLYFVSNNTSKTPQAYIKKLRDMGINAEISNICTPLIPTINYINDLECKNVYVMASSNVINYINTNVSCKVNDSNTHYDAVLICYDDELNYNKLKQVCNILNNSNNITYMATHNDMVCPTENGNIPDVGSFIQMIEIATGRKPQISFGKPSQNLVNDIINGVNKNNITVIGDRIYTDQMLANNIGSNFVAVLSGETKRSDIQNVNTWPSCIAADLEDLL
ncbi:MAG: HAD-IIA family hydrolase [Proteobacteria bacterium]|nr:HAD-IIA family hydrolase [Pseudomonadota bacterium]